MAIVITREPEDISQSKNPIVYHLQSDARIDNPGTAAVNKVIFTGTIADGTVVVLRWKGVEQRMVARTTPTQLGFDFPAGIVGDGYITSILNYFRDNYYLDEDFEVTGSEGVSGYYLEFTAKKPGSTYNFIVQSTPAVQMQIKTAGIDRKVKPNFCIHVESWLEKADGSEFEKIFSESLQVDESGKTEWDLSEILHPHLQPDIHVWEGRQFNRDVNSKRRYYIRYAEAWGERFQIGKITKAENKHIILGGTPYESGANLTVMDVVRESTDVTRDKALRLGPDVRYVYPDEPQFLSFMNPTDAVRTLVSLKVVAKLAIGGESSVLTIDLGGAMLPFDKATANVGYQQLNLNEIIAGNAVESYTVQFFSGLIAIPISRPYTFVLKYEYKPYRRYFVYLNSLGALDTVHTWGKNSQEIELVKQTAEKYLSADYKLTDGTFVDWDIQYRQRFDAATGYRHSAEIRQLRDFYISLYKFRKYNDKALPISLISNSLKEYEDGASLIAQTFEYAYSFEDDTWSEQEDTPDQYAPPPGFQGAAGAPIVIKVPPLPGVGIGGNLLFDQEPTPGSYNLVNSGNIWKLVKLLQNKLPLGVLNQYIRGNHSIGDFVSDALQVINNRLPVFKSQEFPEWIQEEPRSLRVGAEETIEDTNARTSGMYHTPTSSTSNGWPVDGKKASLVRVVNGEAGSRTGSDIVITSDQKMYFRTTNQLTGNSSWKEIGQEARHPRFVNIPRLNVTKNVQFEKYIDLSQYIESYHTLSQLSVEITYNSLKSKGLQIIKDGLQPLLLTFTGKFLEDISLEDDNILVYVSDDLGNQTTLSVKIGTVTSPDPDPDPDPEEPEPEPDNRPECPLGPDFYGVPVVLSNGEVEFGFHGQGVPDLRIKMYIPGVAVAIRGKDNDLISYDNGSAIRRILFEKLPPGEYDMSIEGNLCRSLPDIRRIIIPADNSISWFAGYPKHEIVGPDSTFKLKIQGVSGSYKTEIINMTTGLQLYNENREYIAGVNEVSIPKSGGYAEADYRINVGPLTANIKVGTPTQAPTYSFKLLNGWNGTLLHDLASGPYEGAVPATGYNAVFQSTQLGFAYNFAEAILEIKIAGVWTTVTSAGSSFSVGSGTSETVFSPFRIFTGTGTDSRFVQFNGNSLNRFGEYRFTYRFRTGGPSGTIVQTYQQTVTLHAFEILGVVTKFGTGRYQPLIGKVRYDGLNVQNNNVWAAPFASYPKKLEYSIDGGNNWFSDVSATPDAWGAVGSFSNVWILNNNSLDNFPNGTTRNVIFRNPAFPTVRSAPVTVNNGGGPGPDPVITVPSVDGVKRTQIGGAKFGVINARYITAEIRPSGAVKLNYSLTTRSTRDDNNVSAFLFDANMILLPPAQVTALRSADGLLLEDGDHHFYLYYANPAVATDVDGLFREIWRLFANKETFQSNSFGNHYCMVEIRGLKNSNSAGQIKEDPRIQSAVWYPQAQLLDYTTDFPDGKDFMITKRVKGVTVAQVLTKATGIQARYSDVNNGIIPYENTYILADKADLGAQKSDGHCDYSGSIAPFQTVLVEAAIDGIQTTDIASETARGYRGKVEGNIVVQATIISTGKIRYSITNNGNSTAKLSEGYLYCYIFRTTSLIAQALWAFGARPGAKVTAELNEGGLPPWAVEEVFKKVFDLQKANDGITTVNQQGLVGDYFQALYGYGTNENILNHRDNKPYLRGRLATAAAAKGDSEYYKTGYLYRHRIIGGYVDGIGRLLDGTFTYAQIFNIELNYIAMPDRKAYMWSWLSFEGVNAEVDRYTEQRLPIASPKGDLIRFSRAEASYEMGKRHTFFGLLLSEGQLLWHDAGQTSLIIDYWDLGWIGGFEPGKTSWHGDGLGIVQYDKNNPSHPKFIEGRNESWADTAAPNHNGGYAGAYIYCWIKNMVTESIRYANFSYTLDGIPYSGYLSGNAPQNGSLGNAELSRFGHANPGNHTIINAWERKAGCIVTEGPSGKVAIVWNDRAGATGKTVFTINEFGGRTITHIGSALGIYDISGEDPEEPEEPVESPDQIFHLVMSTTGYGFSEDPTSTTGLHPNWEAAIEAFHFSWGWGITGISVMVPWDKYEITPGNYSSANFDKLIDYCDDCGLSLSVKFKLSRNDNDGFLLPGEMVKGSLGTLYKEGVTGVHATYGSQRVINLWKPAVMDIATRLGAYSRRGYMILAGGHTEELVNHIIGSEGCDFCSDNLTRFDAWCTARGKVSPGTPPMNHGYGLSWPYPDFNQERGKEFGRFMTYNLAKANTAFANAVKSVSDIPVLYYYAAASNLQLRSTANAAMRYIGQECDGGYGSEGDGLYDYDAKLRCNSINLGNFPDGISGIEIDPADTGTFQHDHGFAPPFGQANPQWNVVKENIKKGYDLGAMYIHWAMAFSEAEIRSMDAMLEDLFVTHIGKPYKRPVINSSNLVEVEVTEKYRASADLVEGIDTRTKYVKYLHNNYWGGVNPPSDFSL